MIFAMEFGNLLEVSDESQEKLLVGYWSRSEPEKKKSNEITNFS